MWFSSDTPNSDLYDNDESYFDAKNIDDGDKSAEVSSGICNNNWTENLENRCDLQDKACSIDPNDSKSSLCQYVFLSPTWLRKVLEIVTDKGSMDENAFRR